LHRLESFHSSCYCQVSGKHLLQSASRTEMVANNILPVPFWKIHCLIPGKYLYSSEAGLPPVYDCIIKSKMNSGKDWGSSLKIGMDPQTKESQCSKQSSLLQVRQMAYLPADHFPQDMPA
jgi:hypothetical protein